MPTPFSEVTFERQRPDISAPVAMRVIQREFAHEVASFIVNYDGRSNRWSEGTPVTVRYGYQPANVRTFLGYVNHVEPFVGSNERGRRPDQAKVVCVGATYVMRQQRMQSWISRTPSSVVVELLREFHFSGLVQPYTGISESLTCRAETTWGFLRKLAQDIGWTLLSNGTDIEFRDRLAFADLAKANALVFSVNDNTVISFKAVDGETSPSGGQRTNKVFHGIDPRTAVAYSLSDDMSGLDGLGRYNSEPVFTTFEGNSGSLMEARGQLQGIVKRNQWYIQASAVLSGDARLRPGKLIYLEDVPKREQGYWYVQTVEHDIHGPNGYRCLVTLGRAAHEPTSQRPEGPRRRRHLLPLYDKTGRALARVPASLLIEKTWRAEFAAERVVPGVV